MTTLHEMMMAINQYHIEANPEMPTAEEIAYLERERDRLLAKIKAQGKRVILVRASYLESCGRYVCDGDDGFNGYDPLIGSSTIEEVV